MQFSDDFIGTFSHISLVLETFFPGYSHNICPLVPANLEIYLICCYYFIPLNIFLEWKLNHLPESSFFQNYYLLWFFRNVCRIWLLLGTIYPAPLLALIFQDNTHLFLTQLISALKILVGMKILLAILQNALLEWFQKRIFLTYLRH